MINKSTTYSPLAVSKIQPNSIDPDLIPSKTDALSPSKRVEMSKESLDFLEAYKKYKPIMNMVQIRDNLGVNSMGTANFDNLLLDAQHKSLLRGYNAASNNFMSLVSRVKNVPDFLDQNGVRVHDIARLNQVTEKEDYKLLTFSDTKVNYSVAKYGDLLSWTFEAMTNDSLGALMNDQPERWGRASKRTIQYFVFNTNLDANPSIYDGNSLFDSSNHDNDLGSGKAFGQANLEALAKKIIDNTDEAGNPVELGLGGVIHHSDERFTVQKILKLQREDSDIFHPSVWGIPENRLAGVESNYVTTSRWYIFANTADIDLFELGFLNGQTEPEVWWESPNTGRGLMYDEIVTKCRLVFGGAWLNYRGIARANV